MKRLANHLPFFAALLIFGFSFIAAQTAEKPAVAVLRQRNQIFTIETILPANPAQNPRASFILYRREGLVTKRIFKNENVPDCIRGARTAGNVCKNISFPEGMRFVYTFLSAPDSPDKYSVSVALTDGQNQDAGQLVKVLTDFAPAIPTVESFNADQIFHQTGGTSGKITNEPNGMIKIKIRLPEKPPASDAEFTRYLEERVDAIYDWLEPKASETAPIATVRAEPRTKDVVMPLTVQGFAFEPTGRKEALDAEAINILLATRENFPSEKFDIEVVFLGSPPPEIAGALVNTIPGVSNLAAKDASKIGKDTTLGLRALETNLDLGLAYTSSVEQVEEEGRKFRKRKNNGAVDFRFAPLLNYPLDPPQRFRQFITPIFIDVKASTGKITEKSLSLNRILIGTEYAIRFRPNSQAGRRNKYIFSFRGINASDRDFKRAEGKFNFEFRPLFDFLNDPLKYRIREPLPDSVLIPSNGKKVIPTGWFGYQIQPLIGFEAGRMYRAKRTAFANEESSRYVRRLIVGMDILLNVTRRANIKLTDTFYVRGEAPNARFRNYFNGELEAPLFTSGNTSQSVFFGYERGDQPPFATPSVNALKIGYRVTSNFFGRVP